MVTPLLGRDQLDVAGLERLLERVIGGGVHGVFMLGTTGEAPSLSYRLRREVIDRACQVVRGRVPVIVGITDTSVVEAIQLARHAAAAGAQAVVTAAPYYFPEGQPELIEWAQRLVPDLPLPVYFYNMPQMTKVTFEPETIRQLTELTGIAGLKDSSGDLNYLSVRNFYWSRRCDSAVTAASTAGRKSIPASWSGFMTRPGAAITPRWNACNPGW